MDYNGDYSELVYELVSKLEDAATVPELNGGYPSVALLEEWQKARKMLDFMHEVGFLDMDDLNAAKILLGDTVDEYIERAQDEFENSIERN